MTNDEANELIQEAAQRSKKKDVSNARDAGFAAICLLPFALLPTVGVAFAISSGICVLISVTCHFAETSASSEIKQSDAWQIWDFITTRESFAPPLPSDTFLLKNSIAVLYQEDLQAQVFPLVQAIRLLDAHLRQQDRLAVVENRLNELNALSGAMRVRLAKLRELGEDVPEAQRKLDQIERDEAALENIAAQISASCARLEAIFTGVQHAHQVRQLKRELGELSQVAGSSSDSDLALDSDAFDIERQIGREIETFIRLERETDEHLRDV